MNLDDLYNLMVEAKGTKPGERFFRASESEGPSGMASSPIGKSNYNPEVYIPDRKDPADKGMGDAVSVIKLLGKSFQLLKNDEVFQDQMRGIMNGFKKNRKQISAYQENILKYKPKVIDNLWGRINRLITIVSDPKKIKNNEVAEFQEELDKLKKQKDEEQAELNQVYSEIENVAQENEDINENYLEQLMVVIRHTAKRLFKQFAQELAIENPSAEPSRIVPLHELDVEMLQKEVEKNSDTQLKLLEMLFSEDDDINPLSIFLTLQQERYNNAKQNFFNADRGDNYSISIEQLYKNLPLFALVNYFSHVILKSPVIKLNTKQKKRVDALGVGDNMINRLGQVKNEKQFDDIRPDLIDYLKKLKMDKSRRDMLIGIAKGPFQAIRGRATAAVKILNSLKADNITESFDSIAGSILERFSFDEDDYKLDLMEILEEKSKKCDGPTKKASSDRKGKKWTKCAKQPDGSYKRIHWGQEGVRVTGKSGNTKRKKSFRARHNCANAKPGSANAESCKDW